LKKKFGPRAKAVYRFHDKITTLGTVFVHAGWPQTRDFRIQPLLQLSGGLLSRPQDRWPDLFL
jgi:hypothetical protein